MARRLRREFQGLESLLEPDAQAKQWRALIDKVLYNKGPGPKPIVEQLRLRERLRTLHARRDRYNQVRYKRRYEALMRLLGPRHVKATLALRAGIVEADMNIRDILIGAMAGDRRLTRKLPWALDRRRYFQGNPLPSGRSRRPRTCSRLCPARRGGACRFGGCHTADGGRHHQPDAGSIQYHRLSPRRLAKTVAHLLCSKPPVRGRGHPPGRGRISAHRRQRCRRPGASPERLSG